MSRNNDRSHRTFVPLEAVETGRQMSFDPAAFTVFGNDEGYLPRIEHNQHYIEGVVALGRSATRNGQYRVVCLVDRKHGVLKKYWSATHYGTGDDADKKPAFSEF
jgi:guanyl-specific ribonuclease Sa